MLKIDNKNKLLLLVASSQVYDFAYSNINGNAFFLVNNNLVNCFFYKQPFKNAVGHEHRAMVFLMIFFYCSRSSYKQKILWLDVNIIAKTMVEDIIYRKKNFFSSKGMFLLSLFSIVNSLVSKLCANRFFLCPFDAS